MKWGLGNSYDDVEYLPVKLRAYLDLTKPLSTVGVMGAYFAASVFYFYYTGSPETVFQDYQTIIFVVVTIGLAHGASQALNMAEDADMDSVTEHKKDRPIPSGIVSAEEARTLAWILILAAVGRAYLTNPQFGVMVSILAFFGVFYNLSPIRAKERRISIPWQAVSRGLFSFPTVWAAYGKVWAIEAWVLGIFMFWYVFGFQNSADIIDKDVDEEYGIKTFVVMYGVRGTGTIAAGSTLLMIATILLSVEYSILPNRFIWMLGIIPFCAFMLYHMIFNPQKVSNYTGNHPSWTAYYIGMVLCVLIPFVVEVRLY